MYPSNSRLPRRKKLTWLWPILISATVGYFCLWYSLDIWQSIQRIDDRPLIEAIKRGDTTEVKALLARGANANTRNSEDIDTKWNYIKIGLTHILRSINVF